jgi:hypothetical protein
MKNMEQGMEFPHATKWTGLKAWFNLEATGKCGAFSHNYTLFL